MKNETFQNMKEYQYQRGMFSFEGCVSVQKEGQTVTPWRIDYEKADFYPFLSDVIPTDNTAPVAEQCSGVRLVFITDSKKAILELKDVNTGLSLDLFINHQFKETCVMDGESALAVFNLPGEGEKLVEIWLDQCHGFHLNGIWIDENSTMRKAPVNQRRWVHYGSSISHSRNTGTPSNIWASRVARKLDLHLTSFGFSANCMIEPMVGRLICDRPADFITLKLGVNVHSGVLVRRNFASNVIGLIQIIRDKHPETPLVLISPIYSPLRESVRRVDNGVTLEEMREIEKGIVESCKKYGDKNIYYVDGLKIFGPDEKQYLPDDLHPNAEGQPILAEHFAKEVFGLFNLK